MRPRIVSKKFSGVYCVKCGAAQPESRIGEPCAAEYGKKKCKNTTFTDCLALIDWNTLNDVDARFLKSLRIAGAEV